MIYELQIRDLLAVATVIPQLGNPIFVGSGVGKATLLLVYDIEAEIGFISKLIAYDKLPLTVL